MKLNQRPLILGLIALLMLGSMVIVLLLIRLAPTKQPATLTKQSATVTKQQLTPTSIPNAHKDYVDSGKPAVLQVRNNVGNSLVNSFLWLSVLVVGGYFLWSRLARSSQSSPPLHVLPKSRLDQQRSSLAMHPPRPPTQSKVRPASVPMPVSKPQPPVEPRSRNANHQFHLFRDSVIGKSHIQHGLPCQDSSAHMALDNGWGVAVVADGLGSRRLSDCGSQFVVEHTCRKLFDLVQHYAWHTTNQLPNHQQWQQYAITVFQHVYNALQREAQLHNQSIHEYACTLISVIYSPIGLLVAHVGDGRAGYSDRHGRWHSMITPHKGEEANEVMPFTADQVWKNPQELIECRVIRDQINGFVLISDGCEKHTFQCSQFDQASERWHDPNQPHQQFFDRLQQLFRENRQKGRDFKELEQMFKDILQRGNAGFANEPDDKTMILGLWI